jgi:hypothetical protein
MAQDDRRPESGPPQRIRPRFQTANLSGHGPRRFEPIEAVFDPVGDGLPDRPILAPDPPDDVCGGEGEDGFFDRRGIGVQEIRRESIVLPHGQIRPPRAGAVGIISETGPLINARELERMLLRL